VRSFSRGDPAEFAVYELSLLAGGDEQLLELEELAGGVSADETDVLV
jgi:hypothetical protein